MPNDPRIQTSRPSIGRRDAVLSLVMSDAATGRPSKPKTPTMPLNGESVT